MYSPTLDESLKLAARGILIPVTRRILADFETPLAAYRKSAGRKREARELTAAQNPPPNGHCGGRNLLARPARWSKLTAGNHRFSIVKA